MRKLYTTKGSEVLVDDDIAEKLEGLTLYRKYK